MFNDELWRKCKNRSCMGDVRIKQIHNYLEKSLDSPINYSIAEVGILKGGTSKYISKIAVDRDCFLFDTFSGLPENYISHIDGGWTKNDFSDINLDEINRYLIDCNNIIIKNGIFPESASDINHKYFCFVLIDCILYHSVYNSLVYFKDKIDKYSNIIIDDYSRPDCPGVKIAVDKFLNNNNIFKIEILEDFMVNISIN